MPSWQMEIKTGKEKWDLREERGRGPLSGEESSCTDPVFDFLTPKGVYNMGGSVSEMFIFM